MFCITLDQFERFTPPPPPPITNMFFEKNILIFSCPTLQIVYENRSAHDNEKEKVF